MGYCFDGDCNIDGCCSICNCDDGSCGGGCSISDDDGCRTVTGGDVFDCGFFVVAVVMVVMGTVMEGVRLLMLMEFVVAVVVLVVIVVVQKMVQAIVEECESFCCLSIYLCF